MQDNDYVILLYKQWTDQLGTDEAEQLEDWLRRSPDHAVLAGQLREVWRQVGEYRPNVPVDLDVDFRRLQARLRAQEQPVPTGRVVPMGFTRRLLRIAAAVLVLMLGGWGLWQWSAPVPMETAIARGTEVRHILLSDGTQVWLRGDAALEYPARFGDGSRQVMLRGEAYFEVTHRVNQPFRVETADGDRVEVLGTSFGIRSIADQSQLEVLVRTGRVRFTPAGSAQSVELTSRQKAVFHRVSSQLNLHQEATLNELAWQTGGLEFVSTPLSQVIEDLQHYYGVQIALQNPALRNCRHTAPLTNQPIANVLAGLALTYGLEVSSPSTGKYALTGGSCR